MSDVMLFGVLNMPYDLAMADDLSRVQFYGRAREAAARIEALEAALKWVNQVYPGKTPHGGAIVHMTWEEWNKLREALDLRQQPIPKRTTSTVRVTYKTE